MFEARDFPGGLDRVGMVCLAIIVIKGANLPGQPVSDSGKPAGESGCLQAVICRSISRAARVAAWLVAAALFDPSCRSELIWIRCSLVGGILVAAGKWPSLVSFDCISFDLF